MKLYFSHSSPFAQRIRLALHYKAIEYQAIPLHYFEDEVFFNLGIAHSALILIINKKIYVNSVEILENIDNLFPQKPLLNVSQPAWQSLLEWRIKVDRLLSRLYAPIKLSYQDIGAEEAVVVAYKKDAEYRFGQSIEALANDRYGAFEQFSAQTHLQALSKHLAKNRFYTGVLSIADILLAADLFPLQLLDGISLPIDLMYYIERISETCNHSLQQGLLSY